MLPGGEHWGFLQVRTWQADARGFVRGLLLKEAWEAASAERGMWQVPRDCVFTGQEMVPINILQTDSLNVLPVSSSLGEFPQK